MTAAYRAREDRRRRLVSWGSVAALYLVAFIVLLLTATAFDAVLADAAGPVMVRIGIADGSERPDPRVEPRPPDERPLPPEPPEPVKPEPAPVPKPLPEKPLPDKKPTEKPAEKPAETVPEPPPQARLKGSEQGNTLDMAFDATAGQVGRNLYVPIYLFMPLPSRLEASLVERFTVGGGLYTREERIGIVLKHYERESSGYRLRSQPPHGERSEVWLAIEGAGYNLAKAEYKAGKGLSPITLSFAVGPVKDGLKPRLERLEVRSSSGSAEIDEAVLYGFSRAAFFNSTDREISGSFTYRFD